MLDNIEIYRFNYIFHIVNILKESALESIILRS